MRGEQRQGGPAQDKSMAAICGFFNLGSGSENSGSDVEHAQRVVRAQLECMRHRASSAQALHCEASVGLGQGDASPRVPDATTTVARSRDGRVRCAFAGRLFNAAQVRRELGLTDDSLSAGELAAEALASRGEAGLAVLDGAFALAALDEQGVLLARDAIGEQPLYFSEPLGAGTSQGPRILFASETKAFLSDPAFTVRTDRGALSSLLVFSFIPGTCTMFEGVQELEPGHFVRLRPGGADKPAPYWSVQEQVLDLSEDEAVAQVRAACRAAVDCRTPEGSVAAFLSGGVDSAAVVALLAEAGVRPVCYSAGFGVGQPNELGYARLVADHCGVEHRIVDVEPADFLDLLPKIIWSLDDPLCDCITVPNYILAEHASRESRVVFNGEGGDPLFGGPKNKFMILGEWYKAFADYDRPHAYLGSYHKFYDYYDDLCTPEFSRQTGGTDALAAQIAPYLADSGMEHFLNRLMHINLRLKGGQNILVKVDKMLGANGVSAASPLFDRRLAELSFSLAPTLKRKGDVEKYVFKKAIEDLLPHPVVYRKKAGMGVPLNHWFRQTALKGYAHDVLGSERARSRGYFRQSFVDDLLAGKPPEYGFGRNRCGELLWMLLAIELWHQVFVDGGARP